MFAVMDKMNIEFLMTLWPILWSLGCFLGTVLSFVVHCVSVVVLSEKQFFSKVFSPSNRFHFLLELVTYFTLYLSSVKMRLTAIIKLGV